MSSIKEWAKRITYKPDVIIDVETVGEYVLIRLIYKVEDASGGFLPGTRIYIQHDDRVPVRHFQSFDDFVHYMKAHFIKVETHEALEWFKIDGVAAFPPHEPHERG